jgi:hypothetical protein
MVPTEPFIFFLVSIFFFLKKVGKLDEFEGRD